MSTITRTLEYGAMATAGVRVMRPQKGGHCAFAVVDRSWMSGLVRTFYNYWASGAWPARREAAGQVRQESLGLS